MEDDGFLMIRTNQASICDLSEKASKIFKEIFPEITNQYYNELCEEKAAIVNVLEALKSDETLNN